MTKKQTETVFRHKRIKRKGRHSKKDKKTYKGQGRG